MERIPLYQVDAFADRPFGGNPAAVCPLDEWLPDDVLQAIAQENNLSETAFFVPCDNGFELRWFTPESEVNLCGHATLASAHVVFTKTSFAEPEVRFQTRSGELRVKKTDNGLSMDFPGTMPQPLGSDGEGSETEDSKGEGPARGNAEADNSAPESDALSPSHAAMLITEGLGVTPEAILKAYDYVVVLDNEAQVRNLQPDFPVLAQLDGRGVLVTAPADDNHSGVDFVSRCFFTNLGVDEDPVTGSAHCELAPYWARVLGKDKLNGFQHSRRGGLVKCAVKGERVILTGNAADYLEGFIQI